MKIKDNYISNKVEQQFFFLSHLKNIIYIYIYSRFTYFSRINFFWRFNFFQISKFYEKSSEKNMVTSLFYSTHHVCDIFLIHTKMIQAEVSQQLFVFQWRKKNLFFSSRPWTKFLLYLFLFYTKYYRWVVSCFWLKKKKI